jgi:hypothetical protein
MDVGGRAERHDILLVRPRSAGDVMAVYQGPGADAAMMKRSFICRAAQARVR